MIDMLKIPRWMFLSLLSLLLGQLSLLGKHTLRESALRRLVTFHCTAFGSTLALCTNCVHHQ